MLTCYLPWVPKRGGAHALFGSSWELCLHLPPDLGWGNVAVAPGGCSHLQRLPFYVHVDFFHFSAFGTPDPLGQASKFFFFTPLLLPMDVLPFSYPAGLSHCTSTACLPLLLDCLGDEKKNERCCGSAVVRHPQHLAPQASALFARPGSSGFLLIQKSREGAGWPFRGRGDPEDDLGRVT
jgi:hypothetical protein